MKRAWILAVAAVGFLAGAGPASAHGVRDQREDVRASRTAATAATADTEVRELGVLLASALLCNEYRIGIDHAARIDGRRCLVSHVCRVSALAVSLGFAAGLSWADDAAQPMDETARRIESLLVRSEAISQRPFDARFRAAAARALAALPAEELEARLTDGGGMAPLAAGDSNAQLVYTPLPAPCRIIDTRGVGTLAAGAERNFKVTGGGHENQGGSAAGCGVPFGSATSAVINFVAVNPVGPGNLRAWAYSTPAVPAPNASIVNYAAVSGLNIANGIVVPICNPALTTCPALDLKVLADVSNTHLVADVVGYFERFPKEQVRSFSALASSTTETALGSTCTHATGLQVMITAPVAGRVIVRVNASGAVQHTQGVGNQMRLYVGQGPTDCASAWAFFLVDGALPSGQYWFAPSLVVAFDVTPGSHTYYANALTVSGQTGSVAINEAGETSTIEATFHPN